MWKTVNTLVVGDNDGDIMEEIGVDEQGRFVFWEMLNSSDFTFLSGTFTYQRMKLPIVGNEPDL